MMHKYLTKPTQKGSVAAKSAGKKHFMSAPPRSWYTHEEINEQYLREYVSVRPAHAVKKSTFRPLLARLDSDIAKKLMELMYKV